MKRIPHGTSPEAGRPGEAPEARAAPPPAGSSARGGEDRAGGEGDALPPVSVVIGEVQLLLAEKRTSLAVMRTGIAVLALPLSVASVLIATSKYDLIEHVLPVLIPLGVFSLALAVFGVMLIVRSLARMRHGDRLMFEIKRRQSVIAQFIE